MICLYLNTLNSYINNEISTADYNLLNDCLIEVFKRIEKKDITIICTEYALFRRNVL